MPTPTPQEAADRWVRNIQAAGATIQSGVDAVTESPAAMAARQVDLWLQRLNEQRTREKFVRSLSAVSTEDWKQAMRTKGIPRIQQGATAGRQKMVQFMQEFLPFIESVSQRVRSLPKATLEDRIARMVAQVRGAAEFRRR